MNVNTNHLVVLEADDAVTAANTTRSTVVWQVCRSYHTLPEDLRFVNYLQATTTIADNGTAESLPYYDADAEDNNHNDATDDRDASLLTVQVLAIIACLCGALLVVSVGAVPYCGLRYPVQQWQCYGVLYLLTSVVQGLTLLIVNSTVCHDNPVLAGLQPPGTAGGGGPDSASTAHLLHRPDGMRDPPFAADCELGVGFYCGILSTILWCVAGGLVLGGTHPPPEKWQEECLSSYLQRSREDTMQARVDMVETERKRAAAVGGGIGLGLGPPISSSIPLGSTTTTTAPNTVHKNNTENTNNSSDRDDPWARNDGPQSDSSQSQPSSAATRIADEHPYSDEGKGRSTQLSPSATIEGEDPEEEDEIFHSTRQQQV